MFSPQVRIRIVITLIMLGMGLIGIILTDVQRDGAWYYWHFLTVFYAVMSIGLSAHLKKNKWKESAITIWHELFHWMGLMLCIVLMTFLVNIGLVGRFVAGIEILVLLSLTTYLAGIYSEPSFIPLGILLGIAAAVIGLFQMYLYVIIIPAVIVTGLIIFFIMHKSLRKESGKDVR